MFLNLLQRRNPSLIQFAQQLHQTGEILPDTYVIDVDTLLANAKAIKQEADQFGIELFFMLKQIGRNPYIAEKLIDLGYIGAVTVDYKEALLMMKHNIPLGNVGHLVQIPNHVIARIMTYGVKEITVYSYEKLLKINEIAKQLHIVQNVIIKVYDENDLIYDGQAGGFSMQDIKMMAEKTAALHNINIVGLTAFPCFLYDEEKDVLNHTPNATTLIKAKDLFQAQGINLSIMNMPSATCIHTIPLIEKLGGNQAEPGHALTGTTPYHKYHDEVERPAMLYVTEISHGYKGNSFAYGGGHYRRGHVGKALVNDQVIKVKPCDDSSIDYHFELLNGHLQIGETVIMCFRTQVFVTRSDVALVEGLHQQKPKLIGIYDAQGRKKEG